MSALSPSNRALLTLIADQGPLSAGEIGQYWSQAEYAEAFRGHDTSRLRQRIAELREALLLRSVKGSSLQPTRYAATPVAIRMLAHNHAVAASRSAQDTTPYDGAELRPYTGRPNAMRAFELPSLVNGVARPRVAPRLIGAYAEPVRLGPEGRK